MIESKIKELRTKIGLTQKELAEELDINRSSLAKYELNENEPDFKILIQFSHYFNVSVDYLLGTTDISTRKDLFDLSCYSEDQLNKLNTILASFKNNENLVDYIYVILEGLKKI